MDCKYRAKILKMQALQQLDLYNSLILWKNGLAPPIIVGDICMFNHNLFFRTVLVLSTSLRRTLVLFTSIEPVVTDEIGLSDKSRL